MKSLIISTLLLFALFLDASAQNSVQATELIPYTVWLRNRLKETKNVVCILDLGGKPSKLKAVFEVEPKTLQNGETIALITFKTTTNDVVFEDIDKKITTIIDYFGRITSKDKIIDVVFQAQQILVSDENELTRLQSITYTKSVQLPKGKYILNFKISDSSGNFATKNIKFEIK
jgi:hypothetical protein